MKTIILAAAIAAASAPAFAQSQLERSLGVEAGQYTTAQLVEIWARSTETGNDARVYFPPSSGARISSSSPSSPVAAEIFAGLADADDDANNGLVARSFTNYSTGGAGINARAAAIFAQLHAADDDANNGF